jgi:F0F1-type ATP synthase membrane subunit b/b'
LADYEQKLNSIDQEIERVRVQMREAAEIERKRVLQEAKERRERMERDARILVEQELKAAREQLIQETARVSLESAQKLIVAQLTAGDKERLLQEYLTSVVGKVGPGSNGAARAQGGTA